MLPERYLWKTSINRTILECKFYLLQGGAYCLCVLIEPYWNVNKIANFRMGGGVSPVLIEPYWNVNFHDADGFLRFHSGVRYSKEDIKRRKVERKFDKRSIKKNWRLQTPVKKQ